MADESSARTSRRPRLRFSPMTIMAAVLGFSILLNGIILGMLFSGRATIRDQIQQLAQTVQDAKQEHVRYTFALDREVAIDTTVPIQREFNVPIQTEIRIQQTFDVPLDLPLLGKTNVPIPLDTTVPISTVVKFNLNENVPISTTLRVQADVPIDLNLGDPALSQYLDRLRDALIRLRDEF